MPGLRCRDVIRMIRISRLLRSIRVSSVDEIEFPNLERALRRKRKGRSAWWSSIAGYKGDVRLIHVARIKGRTSIVLDYVFNRFTGEIEHLGIKGVRGWDPSSPGKVELPGKYDCIAGRVKPKRPR